MTIETLPFEHRPRNSIANNLDKINELIDWVNLDTHLYASASGERVTVYDTSSLKGLTVDGRSVQNGTPTPDAPVPVQVVEGRNLLPNISSTNRTHSGVAFSVSNNRIAASGTSTAMAESNLITLDAPVTLEAGKQYTISLSGEYSVSGSSTLFVFYDENSTEIFNSGSQSNGIWTFMPTATMNLKHMRFRVNTAGATVSVDANIQLEAGTTATHYVPHGSIGIVIGDTATPIDLQRNTLASLPAGASVLTSGARDVLRVDSAGHVTADMKTRIVVFDGSDDEGWGIATVFGNQPYTAALNNVVLKPPSNGRAVPMLCNRLTATAPSAITTGTIGAALTVTGSLVVRMGSGNADLTAFKADLASNPLVLVYPLATPQTIDLGCIDPPAIPSGSVVTVSASLTPEFHLEWWVDNGVTSLVNDLIAYIDYKTEV